MRREDCKTACSAESTYDVYIAAFCPLLIEVKNTSVTATECEYVSDEYANLSEQVTAAG